MLPSLTRLLLSLLVVASAASAQVQPGQFGFTVRGTNGTAGAFCGPYSCVGDVLVVTGTDTLAMTVRSDLRMGFAIGVSPTRPFACIPIRGIGNALALSPNSIDTVAIGVITQSSPILACWSGFETRTVTLPRFPAGVTFTLQAVVDGPSRRGGTQPAFTQPVTCVVR